MTTPDRSVNFPTEFRIPTQEITAREVINLFQGHRLDIRVMFGELGSKITLPEYKGLETENRSGEAFVLYPEAIALNGTVVPPESFMEVFQPQEMSDIEAQEAMFCDKVSTGKPLVVLQTYDGLVRINIFSGAFSKPAMEVSRIGDAALSAGGFTYSERVEYQRAVAQPYAPATRCHTAEHLSS